MPELTAQQLYAELYDLRVSDWPGEIDFYLEFLKNTPESAQGVLEIACGTGRITLPLAKHGFQMTGMDISPELLKIAQIKSGNISNPVWVEADMRTFNFKRKFGVVISPGHSFQFMNSPQEQVGCLDQIKQHLISGGWLILHLDHQDVHWLSDLVKTKKPVYSVGKIVNHPITHKNYRYCNYWVYHPSTQTATSYGKWEELDENERVISTLEMPPARLHCAFHSEIEHLLVRCGFTVEALYGDFFRHPLGDKSENMIWVSRLRN
jgi:SAM-dependent methyltransferase